MFQKQDDNKLHPIGYFSQRTTSVIGLGFSKNICPERDTVGQLEQSSEINHFPENVQTENRTTRFS